MSLFGFFDLGDFCLGMVSDNLSVVCLPMMTLRTWDGGEGATQNTPSSQMMEARFIG